MTVSEITNSDLASYLRIAEPTQSDLSFLTMCKEVAVAYIINYTGIASEDLDDYTDLVICVYVLVQDMFDNRTLYVDNDNLNNTVKTILGLHEVNLL